MWNEALLCSENDVTEQDFSALCSLPSLRISLFSSFLAFLLFYFGFEYHLEMAIIEVVSPMENVIVYGLLLMGQKAPGIRG